jgi:plastocyanin
MRPISMLSLVLTLPALALADGGTLTGKVEVVPARFASETVVYLKDLKVPPTAAHKVAIDQKGMRFIPHVVALEVGDTVEFLNHDAVEHNVFTPDHEGYNLGMIKPSASGTYQFSKPGVYTQLCSVHAEMLAYIFVGENPYQAVIDAKGAFRIDHVPPGTWQVAVWNSHLKAPEQSVTVAEGKTAQVNFTLKR